MALSTEKQTRNIKAIEIGELIQNERFDDWWESEPISIPFFEEEKIKIAFMGFVPEHDGNCLAEADNTLSNFLNKGTNESRN